MKDPKCYVLTRKRLIFLGARRRKLPPVAATKRRHDVLGDGEAGAVSVGMEVPRVEPWRKSSSSYEIWLALCNIKRRHACLQSLDINREDGHEECVH